MSGTRMRPVIFGEALFDRFPDGIDLLGGAPFNVAWHLAGLGYAPLFISRVGDDDNGKTILDAMASWGMPVDGVQIDPARPTGQVRVSLGDDGPSYDIVAEQAYDFIHRDAALAAVGETKPPLLYHGTLALRTGVSLSALYGLRNLYRTETFVDVNLRAPWWSRQGVEQAIIGVNHVKLNHEELATLVGRPLDDEADLIAAAEGWRDERFLGSVTVTRGADGAVTLTDDGVVVGPPAPVAAIEDTVGAGDAFAAAMIAGILSGASPAATLRRGLSFAAAICGRKGATSTDRTLYAETVAAWRAEEGP